MKVVSQEEIDGFLSWYNQYKSLRKVSKLSKRSINTVKKYLSSKVKFNLKNVAVKADLSNELLVGTYVGLWMGDGTQYYENRYTIKLCSNKKQTELNEFIQLILSKLFDKKSNLILEQRTNRAYVKFYSEFIYNFVYNYVKVGKNKTLTVRLKNGIEDHSKDFLDGILLGLSLSDGYLKNKFRFNVISKELSKNLFNILKRAGFTPKLYIHNRSKWGWKDLYMVSLNQKESAILLKILNNSLKKAGSKLGFLRLKYGPAVI